MESGRPDPKSDRDRPAGGAGHLNSATRPASVDVDPRPVFWKELYWLTVICLGGSILALLVLAPRLARYRSVADVEDDLRTRVARLGNLEDQYGAAIQAVENDPFYRDEVIREVLRVKKNGEEFLKSSPGISDN